MSILTVENVSHGFGSRQILANASFRLLKGEHVGLVGANGEGKSTFLKIITGQLLPDAGKIEWCRRITTGYLDQHTALTPGKTIRDTLREAFQYLFDLEQEMIQMYEKMADASSDELESLMDEVGAIQTTLEHNGFYGIDAKINEVALGLGLGEIGLEEEVSNLSGGQRAKVLLTKLLLQNPMILIMDEPTNFLDVEHIQWLTNYLKNYENAFILVSHDIPFLNAVANVIYHVENAVLTRYTGNYDAFLQMVQLKKEQTQKAFAKQQKEIDRLEDFVARNKARAATANLAKSRQKKLDKMELIEKERSKLKPSFKFKEARAPGKYLFQTNDLVIGYHEPLSNPLQLTLERGEKIAIKGANGIGKSTLLRTLLGLQKPLLGDVIRDPFLAPGYFEQESSRSNPATALDEVWNEFPSLGNAGVRGALAGCGLTKEHIATPMMMLSGGENAKVRLCKLMQRDVNWLVLDEPTNHLDSEAKAALQKALREFRGTIIIVSHEPEFYEDWITAVWNAESWTTKLV